MRDWFTKRARRQKFTGQFDEKIDAFVIRYIVILSYLFYLFMNLIFILNKDPVFLD